jgi:hypothetical protein
VLRKRSNWIAPTLAIVGAAAAAGAYIGLVRPGMLRWGATDEELLQSYPGDDLLESKRLNLTNAISIHASAAQIWPWLVQLGQGRGGFYTYDWLENMMGLNIHSADRVVPEHQGLKVGDIIPLAPGGFGIPVAILKPERTLVMYGDSRKDESIITPRQNAGDYMAAVWGFHLIEIGQDVSRLVVRWQADWNPSPMNSIFYRAFLEPGEFIMQRGMLLGLKQRVENMLASF